MADLLRQVVAFGGFNLYCCAFSNEVSDAFAFICYQAQRNEKVAIFLLQANATESRKVVWLKWMLIEGHEVICEHFNGTYVYHFLLFVKQ